jgi:hypothetical protein
VCGKLLDQIDKEDGAAFYMKEDHLGRDEVAGYQYLIDLPGPRQRRRISEVGIEDDVRPLLSQSWRCVKLRLRVGLLPIRKKQVMQRVGGNDVPDVSERPPLPSGGRQAVPVTRRKGFDQAV